MLRQRKIPRRLPPSLSFSFFFLSFFFQTAPLDSPAHNARPRGLCVFSVLLSLCSIRASLAPRFDSFVRRSTSYATLNAGSLYSGSGRARKDRDRLEDFGVVVPGRCFCATLRSNMHRGSKGAEGAESTLPDKWLASPCCVPPHRSPIARETSTAI